MGRRVINLMLTLFLLICVAIFVFSAYKLAGIYVEYRKGDKEYAAVEEYAVVTKEDKEAEEQNTSDMEEEVSPRQVYIDFKELLAVNPETVAWIRFDDVVKISYPVVQAEDNGKYLKTTFEGKRNASGALFLDCENSGDFTDANSFIYGHNMKNGSMFGRLRKYKDAEFFKEHPQIYVYTPDGAEHIYTIFSVTVVEDASLSYEKHYETEADYEKYLEYITDRSIYDTGETVSADDTIISLSTCTNVTEMQRLLVHAVKRESR